jgi:hypothetical protein
MTAVNDTNTKTNDPDTLQETFFDAVDLLVRQHRELEDVLEKVLAANSDAEKLALFARAGDHLSVHIASEERVFYPAMHAARTEDDLLESLEEHLSLKRLLADLLALDPSDQTFEPKFKVMKEQAEHHHKEEEEHLFIKARKMLDVPARDALGREMLALQMQLTRDGEPRATMATETATAAPLK